MKSDHLFVCLFVYLFVCLYNWKQIHSGTSISSNVLYVWNILSSVIYVIVEDIIKAYVKIGNSNFVVLQWFLFRHPYFQYLFGFSIYSLITCVFISLPCFMSFWIHTSWVIFLILNSSWNASKHIKIQVGYYMDHPGDTGDMVCNGSTKRK